MALDRNSFNRKTFEKISRAIAEDKIFHAYILEGDFCIDKKQFALEFCKALVCLDRPGVGCDECVNCRKIDHDNYEDLHIVESDGMSVKDEQISRLQEELKKKPMGLRNLAIIKDADTMTPRAQNRLLKTLEEPFSGTVIILLSENRENLLDTIKSRCVLYRLEEAAGGIPGMEKAQFIFEAISTGKSFHELKTLLSSHVKSREEALAIVDGLERIYEKLLTGEDSRWKFYRRDGIIRSIEFIEEARRDIIAKVNYQYAIKNLIIKIGG